MSHATMVFGSMPNSSASQSALRPELRSPNTVAWSMLTEPSLPLEADDVLVEQPLLVFIGNLTDARFTTNKFLKGIL